MSDEEREANTSRFFLYRFGSASAFVRPEAHELSVTFGTRPALLAPTLISELTV